MLRRIVKLIVIVAFAVGLTSARGNGRSGSGPSSLYSAGLEVVEIMSELARSEAYINACTGDGAVKSVIQRFAGGDYSAPKAVYAVSVSDKDLAAMAGVVTFNASEKLKTFIRKRFFGALMTQIDGMSGARALAAASLCVVSKTFVDENAGDDAIYLYTYDDAVPIAVTFTTGDDKSVSAAGVFVVSDRFQCGSADEIKASFKALTNLAAEVTEIQTEK